MWLITPTQKRVFLQSQRMELSGLRKAFCAGPLERRVAFCQLTTAALPAQLFLQVRQVPSVLTQIAHRRALRIA